MAKTNSFDVSTGVDLQEVDNAVNQARKEVATRYEADDDYKLTALLQILKGRLVRRSVPVRNLDEGTPEHGSLGRARQRIGLKQGIDQETGKKISKAIRDQAFKKVQVQIQGEELRVTAPSRDTLQEVINYLKGEDFGVELQFGNYR